MFFGLLTFKGPNTQKGLTGQGINIQPAGHINCKKCKFFWGKKKIIN